VKAQELRIGNWVELKNSGRLKVDADNIGDVVNNPAIFNPIPLSPEVLTACGFEKIGEDGYIIYEFEDEKNPNEGFRVEYEGEGYAYYYPSNTAMDVQINYLHQLQNLYYCLTGEELNYTP
jgi:hypothetical protein